MYVEKNIYESFHLNLIEFLELPRDIIEMMFSVSEKANKSKQNIINDIENNFNTKNK